MLTAKNNRCPILCVCVCVCVCLRRGVYIYFSNSKREDVSGS